MKQLTNLDGCRLERAPGLQDGEKTVGDTHGVATRSQVFGTSCGTETAHRERSASPAIESLQRTPMLFDVPKDSPTRGERRVAFKLQHGIWTHHGRSMRREEHPWCAMATKDAYEALSGYGVKPGDDPFELIASYCRILEDGGLLTTGPTESEAIRALCTNLEVHCPL